MSQQNNADVDENISSSGSAHHSHHSSSHSSSGSHHSSSGHHSSSHHSSSGHHSSSHHSSSHHSSSGHHSSSKHHNSSKHHSSSSRHGSSKHHSSSSSKNDYNYYKSSESEKAAAEDKIRRLGEKFSDTEEKEDVYFSTAESAISVVKSRAAKRKKKKKKNKILRIILGIFLFFFSLLLVAGITLLVMIASGKKDMLDYSDVDISVIEEAETEDEGKTIKYNGKIYKLNENITSIACLGVDKKEINAHGIVGSAGQADTIIVIAFNTENGTAKLISIPRDSKAEYDVYAKDGSFLRQDEKQICLSYAYGDGGETSCKNVVSSIQKLMFGIPIHSYAALDLEGIGPINDSVGGVSVVPSESFADFIAGRSYHLVGEDAMSYVRYRDTDKLDSNLPRMSHQLEYIKSFTSTAASKVKNQPSAVTDIYNTAMNYSYTDIGLSDASYIASRFLTIGSGEFEPVSVPGNVTEDKDGYALFNIDKDAFFEIILSVYYDEVGTY